MFNTHEINIVEKIAGVPPENYVIDTNNTQEITEGIIRKYKRHSIIFKITPYPIKMNYININSENSIGK